MEPPSACSEGEATASSSPSLALRKAEVCWGEKSRVVATCGQGQQLPLASSWVLDRRGLSSLKSALVGARAAVSCAAFCPKSTESETCSESLAAGTALERVPKRRWVRAKEKLQNVLGGSHFPWWCRASKAFANRALCSAGFRSDAVVVLRMHSYPLPSKRMGTLKSLVMAK